MQLSDSAPAFPKVKTCCIQHCGIRIMSPAAKRRRRERLSRTRKRNLREQLFSEKREPPSQSVPQLLPEQRRPLQQNEKSSARVILRGGQPNQNDSRAASSSPSARFENREIFFGTAPFHYSQRIEKAFLCRRSWRKTAEHPPQLTASVRVGKRRIFPEKTFTLFQALRAK